MNKRALQRVRSASSLKGESRFLCLTQPVGYYKVDSFARIFFPSMFRSPGDREIEGIAVQVLRGQIDRAARMAMFRAELELKDAPQYRQDARRLIETVDQIEKMTRWLRGKDIAIAAADLSMGFKAESHSIVADLTQIIQDLRSLQDRSVALKKLQIAKSPSRSDPLARHFIALVAGQYLTLVGCPPPSGRTGPFVRALAAAWEDLKFPVPARKDGPAELLTWLGQKVEKTQPETYRFSTAKKLYEKR